MWPPFSMAVKHGPCLLTLEKKDQGFRNQVPEETSLHLLLGTQDQWQGAEQDQLPCGSTGTSSGNSQEMETSMVWACHTSWQPLQNHSAGYLGGWVTLWSAEEMLDGQHQIADIPAHARSAHKGPLQKRLEEDLRWIMSYPCDDPIGQGTELKWTDYGINSRINEIKEFLQVVLWIFPLKTTMGLPAPPPSPPKKKEVRVGERGEWRHLKNILQRTVSSWND